MTADTADTADTDATGTDMADTHRAEPYSATTIAASPTADKTLIWSDEFDAPIAWGTKWTGHKSSAYHYGNHNPDNNKLDWLTTDAVTVHDSVVTFTATPSDKTLGNGKQAWNTGMLTTDYSSEGFMVQTGDYIETRVKLPTADGTWPALWTWKDGKNEIDSFEYHPHNSDILELTNHVNPAVNYYTADAIAPGQWVTIGTYYGANSVEWYVNGTMVFSDGTGVGASWSAYLILNLSVSNGTYHPAPSGSDPITFDADYIRVYR